jgi:hypothetical protein
MVTMISIKSVLLLNSSKNCQCVKMFYNPPGLRFEAHVYHVLSAEARVLLSPQFYEVWTK